MYKQRGLVLIIVLWFSIVIAVMVATLASEIRLSAKVVTHNEDNLQQWGNILTALRMAEMELLMARMPPSVDDIERQEYITDNKNWGYRFDGSEIQLAYPLPDNISVRIYDHAGKINLRRLSRQRMREILEKQLGDNDPAKLEELQEAWEDWVDSDNDKRMNGAEKEHYERLDIPYQPRNASLETIDELLLVKGYDEVFKDFPLDTAFTVYGNSAGINPNLATREALMLVPGLNATVIDMIIAKRQMEEFKNQAQLLDFISEYLTVEDAHKTRSWFNFSTSNYYTIAIQVTSPEEEYQASENNDQDDKDKKERNIDEDTETIVLQNDRAYLVMLQVRSSQRKPKVLMIKPYGLLPDMRNAVAISEEELADLVNKNSMMNGN